MFQRALTMEYALIRMRWLVAGLVVVVESGRALWTRTSITWELFALAGIAAVYNVLLTALLSRLPRYDLWIGYLTSGVHTVLVSLGSAVTGGPVSIFMPILVLLVLGASIRFPSQISLRMTVGIAALWCGTLYATGSVPPDAHLHVASWVVFLPVINLFVRNLASEEEVQRLVAHQDHLTGLANRRAFELQLDQAIRTARAQPGSTFAVVLVDLVSFKAINDHYGHLAGDHVLTHVARCLERTVREGSDLVARWGGDEFAILLTPADERTAEAVAQRIEQELKTGFRLNGSVVIRVVARVAVQVYDGQVDAQTVMRRVDDQLVRAKERRHVQASGDTGGDR